MHTSVDCSTKASEPTRLAHSTMGELGRSRLDGSGAAGWWIRSAIRSRASATRVTSRWSDRCCGAANGFGVVGVSVPGIGVGSEMREQTGRISFDS